MSLTATPILEVEKILDLKIVNTGKILSSACYLVLFKGCEKSEWVARSDLKDEGVDQKIKEYEKLCMNECPPYITSCFKVCVYDERYYWFKLVWSVTNGKKDITRSVIFSYNDSFSNSLKRTQQQVIKELLVFRKKKISELQQSFPIFIRFKRWTSEHITQTIYMHDKEGKTFTEIAKILGFAVSTVSSHYHAYQEKRYGGTQWSAEEDAVLLRIKSEEEVNTRHLKNQNVNERKTSIYQLIASVLSGRTVEAIRARLRRLKQIKKNKKRIDDDYIETESEEEEEEKEGKELFGHRIAALLGGSSLVPANPPIHINTEPETEGEGKITLHVPETSTHPSSSSSSNNNTDKIVMENNNNNNNELNTHQLECVKQREELQNEFNLKMETLKEEFALKIKQTEQQQARAHAKRLALAQIDSDHTEKKRKIEAQYSDV